MLPSIRLMRSLTINSKMNLQPIATTFTLKELGLVKTLVCFPATLRNLFTVTWRFPVLGAVVVPLNFQLTAREIAYIVKDARMKYLVSMEALDIHTELLQHDYSVKSRICLSPN